MGDAASTVNEVLRAPGRPLDAHSLTFFGSHLRHDFSQVRVHTDARAADSARSVNAAAYTVGRHVVFDSHRYDPQDQRGQQLLAHELAHVAQHGGDAFDATQATLRRRVSVRDVGRGEQSGMGRIDEFVARLNAVSGGLTFRIEDGWLLAEPRQGGTLNEFDRQMQAFIADAADIPMRMTNRHGLLGTRATGFHTPVELDAYQSAYVDIDDFLASSPTDFMTALVHLLRERQHTRNYARRIGTPSLDTDQPGPGAEFQASHSAGLDAELAILRDYLQDPTVRFIDRESRLLRNGRGDVIRERLSSGAGGLNAGRWIVVLHENNRVISLEEYREFLERERVRQQIARERSQGATEHREAGRSVPAP